MSDGAALGTAPAAPPPTPFERRRRRRRGLVLAGVLLVALVGGVTAVVLGSSAGNVGAPSATNDGGSEDAPDEPSPPGAGRAPTPLERPDPTGLGPEDRALAEVLIDVDEAELVMLVYDEELTTAFGGAELDDDGVPALEAVLAAAAAAAGRGEAALVVIAERLAVTAAAPGAEAVRAAYVPHLEAWRAHLARVAVTPDVLLADGATEADTAEINVTADAFRRALEEVLRGTVDPEVAAYGEAILDRGFRGYERDAEVSAPAPAPSSVLRASARSAASSATSASMRSSS